MGGGRRRAVLGVGFGTSRRHGGPLLRFVCRTECVRISMSYVLGEVAEPGPRLARPARATPSLHTSRPRCAFVASPKRASRVCRWSPHETQETSCAPRFTRTSRHPRVPHARPHPTSRAPPRRGRRARAPQIGESTRGAPSAPVLGGAHGVLGGRVDRLFRGDDRSGGQRLRGVGGFGDHRAGASLRLVGSEGHGRPIDAGAPSARSSSFDRARPKVTGGTRDVLAARLAFEHEWPPCRSRTPW